MDKQSTWADRAALGLLCATTAATLAGFAAFGRHPERLAGSPAAAQVYGWMLRLAPPGQIAVAFAALAIVLSRHAGRRWLSALAALYVVSLASELAGTTAGIPFGPYQYGNGLGVKWLGHVPVVIPLSWFVMAVPSYAVGQWYWPERSRTMQRILLGACTLAAWDLALDPAMTVVAPYWIWGTTGPYYGMPLVNLAGWLVTGTALMIALALLRADEWVARVPPRWLLAFYGANLLLPVGLDIVGGLHGAVAITALGLATCWIGARAASRAVVEAAP